MYCKGDSKHLFSVEVTSLVQKERMKDHPQFHKKYHEMFERVLSKGHSLSLHFKVLSHSRAKVISFTLSKLRVFYFKVVFVSVWLFMFSGQLDK